MKRFLVCVLLSACAAGPDLPASQQARQGDLAQAQILFDKADELQKNASRREDIEPTMKAFEAVLAVAPDHKEALVQASRFRYHYAADVLTEKDKEGRLASWLKGREYGLLAMAQNPAFRTEYEKEKDMLKAVPLLVEADGPAALWAGLNWAKWGELYGIMRAAIDIPKVKAILERVNELTPAYDGNAADRFFMGYWVAIPSMMGRDPKKSTAAYEHAIKMSPNCTATHVTYAWYFARDAEDRPMFEALLKKALDAPEEPVDSPLRLVNGLAKQEAQAYMVNVKELFE